MIGASTRLAARVIAVAVIVLPAAGAVAQTREIERAKLAYCREVAAAEDRFVSGMEALVPELLRSQKIERAVLVRERIRGVRLGRVRGDDPSEIEELRELRAAYAQRVAEAREQWAAACEQALAGGPASVELALQIQEELKRVREGKYEPSAYGTERSGIVGARFLGEAGRLWALSETIIPDELSVAFRGRRATISGTGQHETIRFEGKAAGHFGKGVLFQQPPQEGLLLIDHPPTSGRTAYKAVFVAGSRAVALEPLNIEPGEVYTWTVDVERPGRTRRQVRFRLLRGEETVHELVAPPGATTFGFVATVRHRGDRAGLTVSFK